VDDGAAGLAPFGPDGGEVGVSLLVALWGRLGWKGEGWRRICGGDGAGEVQSQGAVTGARLKYLECR